MSPIPPLNERIVRVVVRMGGTSAHAAQAIGCSMRSARDIARRIGVRFGSRLGSGIDYLTEPEPHP
jgi:hypothetical protein